MQECTQRAAPDQRTNAGTQKRTKAAGGAERALLMQEC